MADINFKTLIEGMTNAIKGSLTGYWKEAKPYAENEVKAFANNIKLIATLKAKGSITLEQAKIYLDIQKSSMRVVLLAIEGLTILAVENAINAALDVIRKTVNTALGWAIL